MDTFARIQTVMEQLSHIATSSGRRGTTLTRVRLSVRVSSVLRSPPSPSKVGTLYRDEIIGSAKAGCPCRTYTILRYAGFRVVLRGSSRSSTATSAHAGSFTFIVCAGSVPTHSAILAGLADSSALS